MIRKKVRPRVCQPQRKSHEFCWALFRFVRAAMRLFHHRDTENTGPQISKSAADDALCTHDICRFFLRGSSALLNAASFLAGWDKDHKRRCECQVFAVRRGLLI